MTSFDASPLVADGRHHEILSYWREIAAERIIDDVESSSGQDNTLQLLLQHVFGERHALENAVRRWAVVEPAAKAAVRAIDRRRLTYVESLLREAGIPREVGCARARILYCAYLGFALSDRPLPPPSCTR